MNSLTGTGALTRLALRRDRIMIVVWLYALVALVAASVYGFKKLYPNAAGREQFIAAAGHNPALLSIYGPLYGSSLGTLTAWRDTVFCSIGAALMSIFIVIRHTRADEESGRLELIGSAPIGRHAALVSALIVACVANIVIGVLIVVVAVVLGLPAAGTIAMAGGIVGCGLAFTAVAAFTAQIAQTGRSARGLAIIVVVAAFLVRAIGDSTGASGPHWLTWVSPLGWAELNQAFSPAGPRWWLLALPVATALVFGIAGALLAARRDYAAGMLAQRPGRPRATATLRSPMALAWRLQGPTLLVWAGAGLVYGIGIGSATKGIGGLLGSKAVRKVVAELGGKAALTSELTNAFLAAILSFAGLIAAGYAISAVLRLRSEETEERADAVLATSTGRIAWGLSHLVIAVSGTVAILALTGLGAGLGYDSRLHGGGAAILRLLGAGLAQVPAALVIGGIAAALVGLAPKAAMPVSWGALGVVVLLLLVGSTVGLSHWVLDVSPFTHLPKLPGGTVSALPLVLLSVIALTLGGAGLAGLRRRDIG